MNILSSKNLLAAVCATAAILPAGSAAAAGWTSIDTLSGRQATLTPDGLRVIGGITPAGAVVDGATILDNSAQTLPQLLRFTVGPDGTVAACVGFKVGPDFGSSPTRYGAAVRPPGGIWEPVTVLATGEVPAASMQCDVDVSTTGSVAVVVTRDQVTNPASVNRRRVVELYSRTPNGSWTAGVALSDPGRDSTSPHVEAGANGAATAVWLERHHGGDTFTSADDHRGVHTASRAPDGTVGTSSSLFGNAAISRDAADLRLAGSASGRLAVAWTGTVGTDTGAWVAHRPIGGAWQPGALVLPDAAPTDLAVSALGAIALGVDHQDRPAVLRRANAWSPARQLGDLTKPSVAVAFQGEDVVAAFTGDTTAGTDVLRARRWAEGEPAPAAGGLGVSLEATSPQLATDGAGTMLLTFKVGLAEGLSYSLLDERAPALASPIAPVTTEVGKQASLNATFADPGTGVASVSWDFGDGTSGSSASVSHTWAQAGTYTAAVTATDGSGNERIEPVPVTVLPASGNDGNGGGGGGGGGGGNQDDDMVEPPMDRAAVTVAQPRCAKRMTRARCAARRAAPTRWRRVRGTVVNATAVTIVAIHRRPGREPRRISRAAVVEGTTWTVRLPKLGRGRLRLRVTATGPTGEASALVRKRLR